MHIRRPWILAVLLFAACSRYDREMETILHIADRRVAVDSLQTFLTHPSERVRKKAVAAAGQMMDTAAVSLLLPLLRDPAPEVRVEAVFALGQLGTSRSQDALMELYERERDLEVRLAIIEALGKMGDLKAWPLLRQVLEEKVPALRAEAALSVGRLAYRKIIPKDAVSALLPLRRDPVAEIRWRVMYALMRLADSTTASVMQEGLKDRDARVRMQAARGLGVIRAGEAVEALEAAARTDPDWRVRVNAARALGQIAPWDLLGRLPIRDENHHVRIASLQALENALQRTAKVLLPIREFVALMNDDSRSWREKGLIAGVLALKLKEEALPLLAKWLQKSDANFQAMLAAALGKTGSLEAVALLDSLYQRGPAKVAVHVLYALSSFPLQHALPIYRRALRENDAVLTAIVAQNLSRTPGEAAVFAEAFLQSVQRLPVPIDTEPAAIIFEALAAMKLKKAVPLLEKHLQVPDRTYARAAARALQTLTGRDYSHRVPKATEPKQSFTWEDIQALHGKRAVIKTVRGDIEIQLFPQEAPLTVLTFVRLAERGFYDGLTFHRVVPNFVIQGGDPRGDSWGSPGFTIRSEFNRHPYLRGMVGMASAGPDTEGCQFFITHSEQPHLDGRYTVFGRVVSGQDVVDAIQAGDTILKIEIH